MPYFSIVIPLYNKENFIAKTLQSVLNQTFADYEVIIVNDGSTDKSVEIVNQFTDGRIKIYHQKNQGVSVARNHGIEISIGKFICFLDADDEWSEDFLLHLFNLIKQFPEQNVFAAAIELDVFHKTIPARYSISNEVEKDIYIEDYFEASKAFSILWTSSTVINREVFNRVGSFDESIRSGQDTDLWIRIGEIYKVVFLNKILAKYTQDTHSLSRRNDYKKISKIKYEKFEGLEKENPNAKYFLDQNRFFECITLKLQNQEGLAQTLSKEIQLDNLSLKRKILLATPPIILKRLVKIQPFLIKIGARKTYYK